MTSEDKYVHDTLEYAKSSILICKGEWCLMFLEKKDKCFLNIVFVD